MNPSEGVTIYKESIPDETLHMELWAGEHHQQAKAWEAAGETVGHGWLMGSSVQFPKGSGKTEGLCILASSCPGCEEWLGEELILWETCHTNNNGGWEEKY